MDLTYWDFILFTCYYILYFTSLRRLHVSRTKREISVAETSQLKGNANYAKEINLEHEEKSDDLEEDDTYQDGMKKNKFSRKAADSMISTDFYPSHTEVSFDRDTVSSYFNSQRSNERLEETEADNEATKGERNKNEEASNLVRLPRNINSDFNRYTDQDERSSLYDDYEAKEVAKRGVLNGSEDYEEMEDDLPGIEDMAAVQESTNKAEMQKDARVKRDQAEEILDKSKSSLEDPAKLEESKTVAKNPYTRQVSHIELSESFNKASTPNHTIKKSFGSKDVISKSSGSSEIQESANIVASPKKDESNVEYEKRVEEEIQRKIDSIKEEIQRDIEAQQRIRDIEDNNARFDELHYQEQEDEERQNFEDEPIKKRQTIAKRSIREITDDATASFKKNEKKQSSRREQYKKRQHRSSDTSKLDTSKENENLKSLVMTNDKSCEQIPTKRLFKKKRERVRQIFLMNNDQHQTKRRQLRSYTLPSDRTVVKSENELFINPDLNSYIHADKMVKLNGTKTIYDCAMYY